MGIYEDAYKNCMDAHRIRRKLDAKQLTLGYSDRFLNSAGYPGTGNRFFADLSLGGSDAGISVNQNSALTYTAYWSCVTLLAGTVASLSLFLFRRQQPRGREKAIDHPLYQLLHSEPNPEMDSFSYFESMMFHLCANNGNAYSYIDWDNDRMKIEALWLMNPERTIKMRDRDKNIYYEYQSDRGPINLPAYHVWHVPGFGYDGLTGYTPLTYARNQIGLGLATEKMGAKLFANGLTIGGVLEHPGHMTKPAQDRFKATIEKEHQGVDKAHRLLILEEGMKYNKNNIPPEDAQMLETRKFQRNEMASFFHIPPHMIGDLERATFSNIEEQSLEYVQYAVRHWLVRIERSANRQLLLPQEKNELYAEFLVDSLLRGNFESRVRGYWTEIQSGILSPNEARERENMNPRDGGDVFLQPVNMIVSGQQATLPPAKPAG